MGPGLKRNHSSAILLGGPIAVTCEPHHVPDPHDLVKPLNADHANNDYCGINDEDDEQKPWSNGIFAMPHPMRCLISCLFPCATTPVLAKRTDQNPILMGALSFIAFPFVICALRGKTREQNKIEAKDQNL